MHACDGDTCKFSPANERVLVLRELVTLREVGVKIILAIEFRIVGERASERRADTKHVPDRFPIDDRERSRVREAHWADVHIRPLFIGVVPRIAEHLRSRF